MYDYRRGRIVIFFIKMNKSRIIASVCAASVVMVLFACNKNITPVSSNGGGGNNNNTGGSTTFAFAVGDDFQYQQYTIDSTGAETPTTTMHEYIASTLSIYGKSNVFLAIDSTFTAGALSSVDTVYYYTDGISVSQYGLVSSYENSTLGAFVSLLGTGSAVTLDPQWNMLIDAGSRYPWIVDTSHSSISLSSYGVTIPITTDINGTDVGDTTMIIPISKSKAISGSSLNTDQSFGTGSLSFDANILIITVSGSATIDSRYYMSFSPTCIVKAVTSPTTLSISESGSTTPYQIPGAERDLISWSKN